MEQYSRTAEESHPDPQPGWAAPVPETGLEEPAWQLDLGDEESYPKRPGEADCIYYLRTGFCGYGSRCRFNHPSNDKGIYTHQGVGAGIVKYPERIGQPICQYYMRTGMCKFGASCKYHHPKQGDGSVGIGLVSLNYYGYPLRPGEKECSYYVKTGHCSFGATCKYHHPQPDGIQLSTSSLAPQVPSVPVAISAPTVYPPGQTPSVPSSQQYGVVLARSALLPSSYVNGPYGPMLISPGMVPYPSWSSYPASISPVASPSAQPTIGPGPLYGVTQLSSSAPLYMGSYQPMPSDGSLSGEQLYPQRPGQPECQYYMRTGDCKFGSSCKYHHPPELMTPRTDVVLSSLGLPLRLGAPPCIHFAQHGVCKFGLACKFDHSMRTLSYSIPTSSLADMPGVQYPVESFIGTITPSFSSSELRPKLISARMSSSMAMSRSELISHSTVQQSSQSSGPSASNNSTEARN